MKRLFALMTAVAMIFAMATVAFAEGPSGGVTSDPTEWDYGDTTQTAPDGTEVKTTEDGTVVTTEADGDVDVALSEAACEEEVALPVELEAEDSLDEAPLVTITFPEGAEEDVKAIDVPLTNPGKNVVVYVIGADGSAKLVKASVMTEDGVRFPATGDQEIQIKVVDNAKTGEFVDVADWSEAGVAFVTSHEIFIGNEEDQFVGSEPCTRAQLFTILSRMADAELDTEGENWADAPIAWAIAQGYTDGSEPDAELTRAQLATMLYRFAGSPAVTQDLSSFSDAADVADWAAAAMQWAVNAGILQGGAESQLDPNGTATRNQVAAVIERFYQA